MGQVWQATDTTLNRQVALKILPDAFADDPDRLARFQREAQVLASLNHPNIGAIHGLEEAEGTTALVLELIEGPTLADRIRQGPVPMDDALPIAKQIAEALEAAHERGVIHRDLKPANIKVRADGTVKVLDFGLAKALDPASEGDPSQSPTLTAAATQMGVIMGTAAYMSPEQARGKPVDKRADIWAFGAVLFEMLTGAKPFPGDDVSQTLARVIDRDPDWDALPVETPPAMGQLLRRCLDRDPRQRLRDIGEARVGLGGAVAVPEPKVDPLTAGQTTPRRAGLSTMLASAIVGGLVVGGIVWSLGSPDVMAPNPPLRLTATRLTNPLTDMAISPDGTRIAYTAGLGDDGRLFLHDLRDGATRELYRSVVGGGVSLAFSPDSEWVAFHSVDEETLYRLSLQGGSALPIADLDEQPEGLSWGSNDTLVFSSGGRLMRVAATGGTPEPVTTPDDAQRHRWPELLPNESGVLFTIGTPLGPGRLAVASLPSGTITELGLSGTRPRYASTGHLVFADGDTLRAARFDADERALLDATPVPLREEVELGFVGTALFDLSDTGTLAVAAGAGGGTRSLVWVHRDGREEPVDAPLGSYATPRLSSNDTRLAVDRTDGGDSNIWVRDLVRGTETLVTTDSATDWMPLWTPDDQRLIFFSRRVPGGLYSKAADGTGEAELLVPAGENLGLMSPSSWAPDGGTLAVWQVTASGQPGIALVSLSGAPTVEPLLESRFEEAAPAVSPDGRWLAYHSAESGQREIYVQRFPELGARTTVSTGGGAQPQWSDDGRELFYRTTSGGMMAVAVETEPAFRVLGDAELLFERPYFMLGSRRTYDVSSDGQRFLMVKVEESGPAGDASGQRIDLTVHWFEELKRLVPVN